MNDLKFAFRQLLKNRGFTVVSRFTTGVCCDTGQLRGDWLDIRGYQKSKPRANSGFKVIRFHNSIARVTPSMKQRPLVPVFSNDRA